MAALPAMTKDELKAALSQKGGIVPPAAAKKDELIALYEEYVTNAKTAEFSADEEAQDEEDMPLAIKKRNSPVKKATVDSDLTDVTNLTDDELAEALINRGIEIGPIVDSTRSVYRKKLANYLKEEGGGINGDDDDNTISNGNGKVNHNGAGEFSADDEEVNGQEEEEEEEAEEEETETDDEQPSAQVSKGGSNIVESPSQNTSPLSSMRHRFLGEGRQNHDTSSGRRFTPTPRRSIHSYKVTETTRQTMTKNPDGSISRDYDYKKVTSEGKGMIGGGGKIYALVKMLPGFFLLLMVIALTYYIYSKQK